MTKLFTIFSCFIFYDAFASIDEVIKSNLLRGQNTLKDEKAAEVVPLYSKEAAIQEGSRMATKDEVELRSEAMKKINSSKSAEDLTGIGIAAGVLEKQPLDGFWNHSMFQKADKIWNDPVSLMNEIGDCKTRVNNAQNHYSKRIIKTKKFDEIIEKKICEKPARAIVCEKLLKVTCKAMEECNANNIVLKSLSSSLKWDYQYPIIRIGIQDRVWGGRCIKHTEEASLVIDNLNTIKEFRLMSVKFVGQIRVTINNQQVYIGPYSGYQVNVREGGTFRRSKVDTGHGLYECDLSTNLKLNIDLKPHLRLGVNVIRIEIVVKGRGGGQIAIQANQQCCTKFNDMWEKRCYML